MAAGYTLLPGQSDREHRNRERRIAVMVLEALRQARQFAQVSQFGTIDEKRTLIRAFVKGIDFDPTTRTGTAFFWMVPPVGQDDEVAGGRGTRFITEDANSASEAAESAQDENASLPLQIVGTRYAQKRTALREDGSSLIMVAGARSAALEKMRTRRWVWRLPFEALGRALDAMWEEAKLGLRPVAPTRKSR